MHHRVVLLTIFVALGAAAVQASTEADPYYVAAVVEYSPMVRSLKKPEDNMLDNVRAFRGFMAEAKKQDADIIVFPENGVVGFSNLPFWVKASLQTLPCTQEGDFDQPLRELSCLAAEFKMYLVVNIKEKSPCSADGPDADPRCPGRGAYHFNSQVVFDRSGRIISKYRKYHLFGEVTLDTTPQAEVVTFDTDFGVRFGTFVCFDILFDKPSVELVKSRNVTDFVFSTAWFSEVPFLTAVQAHSAWAHSMNVTVLAAGLNYPPYGSTGSGVYLGRHGILADVMSSVTESRLLVQRVPKAGRWDEAGVEVQPNLARFDPVFNYASGRNPFDEMRSLRMIQDNMTLYTTRLLERPGDGIEVSVSDTLCSDVEGEAELCCRFEVTARGADPRPAVSAAVSTHGYSWRRAAAAAAPTAFNKTEAEEEFDGFHYRLAVFSGVRDHSHVATTGVQVCGIISCLNKELASCGWLAPNHGISNTRWTEFVSISIEGEYKEDGTLQMASTLGGPRYQPLPASTYSLESTPTGTGRQTVSLSLHQPMFDIRTFAIYGRYFAWDGRKASGY